MDKLVCRTTNIEGACQLAIPPSNRIMTPCLRVAGKLREDTVVEAKATLKVVRTGVEHVLICSKLWNATLC